MREQVLHVRGPSALNRRASLSQRLGAAAFDLGAASLLSAAAFIHAPIQRFPTSSWFVVLPALWAGLALLPRVLRVRTLGERLWWMIPSSSFSRKSMLRPERIPATGAFLALTATLATWLSFSGLSQRILATNPAWIATREWELSAELPDGPDWVITPFFYSIASWPRTFGGEPVTFELPYEKGPPTRFIGHIRMQWEKPEIILTLEGPKTPIQDFSREELKSCLVKRNWSMRCFFIRRAALGRHLDEFPAESLEIRWFSVSNPAIPIGQQPQGVFIQSSRDLATRRSFEHRYIFVTEKGTQQTLSLGYLEGETGQSATQHLERIVRSMRISEDLRPGLDWINQALGKVNLREIKTRAQLAEIQLLLLSKISIDPKQIEPFFHLAGVSRLYGKDRGEGALIQGLARFAQDIAPGHPLLARMARF